MVLYVGDAAEDTGDVSGRSRYGNTLGSERPIAFCGLDDAAEACADVGEVVNATCFQQKGGCLFSWLCAIATSK